MITIRLYPSNDKRRLDLFTNKEFIHNVDTWLLTLQPTKRGKASWRFNVNKRKGNMTLTFVRYEDAVAFKLAFGL